MTSQKCCPSLCNLTRMHKLGLLIGFPLQFVQVSVSSLHIYCWSSTQPGIRLVLFLKLKIKMK